MNESTPIDAEPQKNIVVLYKLTVSFAILLSIVLIYGIYQLGSNATLAGGFLGALLIYLGFRPRLTHVGLALTGGAAVMFLDAIVGGTFGKDSGLETLSWFMGIGAFLGAGSILFMALHKVWTGSSQYAVPLRDALILPVFSLIAILCMQFTNSGHHLSFDFLLYRFDSSLGLAPGHGVVSLFRQLPWIRTGSLLTYNELLIFPPLYHAWARYKGKASEIHLIYAFAIAGVSGFVLYHICPALGPRYAFGAQFPDRLPPMSAVPVRAFISTGVNNAMPSLHMTWVLLVWIAAWELGPSAVAIASVIVTFTGLATLGFGEHYLIDLIAAAPLTMMVYGICAARHKLTAVGLGLVLVWTGYLRTGIQLPSVFNWLAVIVTVFTSVFLTMRALVTRAKAPKLTLDLRSRKTILVATFAQKSARRS